ncbi:MAG TPA: FtsX-like permease family protein [Stellaceae bacterium]|nr:FtsX-like permease family protein [Stellaceae bacterium]
MSVPLAWRLLAHDKRRTALAVTGIFLAIALVFLELGLFFAVPRGGLLLFDHMRFDLMLTSSQYQYQSDAGAFPAGRLAEVQKLPQVAQVIPLTFAAAKWQGGEHGEWIDLFVIGFSAAASPFTVGDINRQLGTLRRPDTILVDDATRPMFGPLTPGRVVAIDGRPETIGGTYRLGTGFMGLGVALFDMGNFARLFPLRGARLVNLAAIVLKPGVDADAAARALRRSLPDDVRVWTRPQLNAHEVSYWTTRSAVGVIFGSGLVIAIVVGIMIVYQTLATQISRHLPQFATMKAVGYGERSLYRTVAAMAAMIMALGFVPAFLAALWLYAVIRQATMLPAAMTGARVAAVVLASFAIAMISAALSMTGLRRADPADVFDGRP